MHRRLHAVLVGIYRGLEPHSFITTPCLEAEVTFEGLSGDRHCGLTRPADGRTPYYPRGLPIRNSRQVTLVSLEELGEVARVLGVPQVRPEWLGANLALQGLPPLTYLPPGTRLFFPHETVLVVEGENLPCRGPGEVIQKQYPDHTGLVSSFPRAALHRRGLAGWVERPGKLRVGDEISILLPELPGRIEDLLAEG